MAVSTLNPVDYLAIKNTIARYCIALDSKDWQLLKTSVFHPDIQGDFPFDHDMRGADALLQRIQGRLVLHLFFPPPTSFIRLTQKPDLRIFPPSTP